MTKYTSCVCDSCNNVINFGWPGHPYYPWDTGGYWETKFHRCYAENKPRNKTNKQNSQEQEAMLKALKVLDEVSNQFEGRDEARDALKEVLRDVLKTNSKDDKHRKP